MTVPQFRSMTSSNGAGSFRLHPSLPEDAGTTEFDQFSDLAKKLVGVPKSEVDEQRQK